MEPLANSSAHALAMASVRSLLTLAGEVRQSTPTALSVVSPAQHEGAYFAATVPSINAEPADVLAQAHAVALESGRSHVIWAGAGTPLAVACWQAGLDHTYPLAVMSASGLPPELDPTITVVNDDAGVEAFREVQRQQFDGVDDLEGVLDHIARPELLLGGDVRAVVRFEGDRPVACGQLLDSHNVRGIFWVATVHGARRKGHGAAVTRALMGLVDADEPVVLQATRAGRPVYEQLGFTTHGLVDRWIVPPETPGIQAS